MLSILIMAAGESSRFGGCKSLAEVKGKSLLQHVIDKAEQLQEGRGNIQVVTGAWHEQIQMAMQSEQLAPTTLLFNPDWPQGLGSSIAFAVKQLPAETSKVLILLADQIDISVEELKQLLEASAESDISCAYYSGKRGVPAAFKRKLFPLLTELKGDRGAKKILTCDDLSIATVAMESASIDIDTKQELIHFLNGKSC